ncbi:MAG: ABC transporter ATP-binding protein/permease [Clostridiales bacterium]|jgi:ATP-binding cassette subfamily B protein|nr:ABC transporter ATP-binding protein/permease [Clostridiales bacterium]
MDNYFEEQDYTKSFDISLWKKLFSFCAKYKRNFVLLFLFSVLLAVVGAIFPQMTGYAIDNIVEPRDLSSLPAFIAIYAGLIVFQAVTVFAFIFLAGRIDADVSADVREAAFHKLQNLSFSYFDNTPVGWIMARLTSDTFRLGEIVSWGVVDIVHGIFMMLAFIVFMLFTDVRLTLIMLAIVPFLVIASVYFQKRILKAHRESRKLNSKITGAYNEGISGAKTTKTLIREQKNFEEFEELSGGMRKASIKAATIGAVYFPIVLSLTGIGVALILGEGGRAVMGGVISLGTLTIFVSYVMQMSEPVMEIARVLSEMQAAQASAERTVSLLEAAPDVVDSDEIIAKYGDFENPKPETWDKIKGNITFKDVSFHYKTGEKVLSHFDLDVRPGEKIALVGETGSGKSTIVNLLCRFYEPTSGQILIDGMDYRERPQIWLQSNLGYVLQSPHLFSGTVRDNIRYGKLEATDEEIVRAAKIVDAYNFIMKMEKGFDSDVGEGGGRLSTGEKQLVSFARAIIKDPAIFVLDEATSSIDTQTEAKIQSAIFKILEGRTSFIVAHRLSTIRFCDRILVIDEGKILEQGTHSQLLRKRGHYYNLYTNQFKKEAESRILGI